MPVYSYECHYCGKRFDRLRSAFEPNLHEATCSCKSIAKRRPTAPGGYQGDLGGASTRPKGASSGGNKEPFNFDNEETD